MVQVQVDIVDTADNVDTVGTVDTIDIVNIVDIIDTVMSVDTVDASHLVLAGLHSEECQLIGRVQVTHLEGQPLGRI